MGKIRVLPEQLVNQIAAGEVVERPASVVKELCENSLDAGARVVRVELGDGGLSRILIVDDGHGMSAEDARTCLERHATSKLVDAEGLTRIATLGFRGEAVPAIASVSRFTLTTREPTSDVGTRVVVEGGRIDRIEEIGAPVGTSVLIEDLFFNTPARRKFLKRAETEAGHASEAVIRLALARPEVGFTLVSGGRQNLSAPAAQQDPRERIAAALGKEVFEHLVEVDGRLGGTRVRGFVASPDYTLSTARGIYTFVNGRYVRDRGLIAAIQRAFSDAMMPGRQPAAVLFLEVPFEEVDVNVHPQKLEVRFTDSRATFEAVFHAVQGALRRSPWLTARRHAAAGPQGGTATDSSFAGAPASETAGGYSASLPQRDSGPVPLSMPFGGVPIAPLIAMGMGMQGGPPRADEIPPPGFFHTLRVIGQFARTYLVCEAPGPQLVVIDQHAAHERLRFHQLREAFRSRKPQLQSFLFPASVDLPLAEARVLADHLEEVRQVGFDAEPFGGTTFALKAVPAPLVGCDYRVLLTDLAGELMQVEKGRAFESAMEEVLASMACHSAVRAHQSLSQEESRALLDALDAIDFNTRCPHGRPVAAQIPLAELEKRVERR
ncbi:MAG: DNA mismatch repair endonuclease MutL [Deltaproteobacteria bacterium]|nr:DNA mismatch repair endonuclease MutL [Deltaproteobacteria bacterium]